MSLRHDDAATLARAGMIGQSPAFIRMIGEIRRFSAVDVPVQRAARAEIRL